MTALGAVAGPVVRAGRVDDLAAVQRFLEGLSTATAYRRFLTGIGRASMSMVRRLLVRSDDRGAFVAELDGTVVGHCSWSRTAPDCAELAVVVADDWQHRGIGRALGTAALTEAAEKGVTHASLAVHSANDQVIELVQHVWPAATVHEEDGLLVYDVALAA